MNVDESLLDLVTLSERLIAGRDRLPSLTAKKLARVILDLNQHIMVTGQLPKAWQPCTRLSDVLNSLPDNNQACSSPNLEFAEFIHDVNEPEVTWEETERTSGLHQLLSKDPPRRRNSSQHKLKLDLSGSF